MTTVSKIKSPVATAKPAVGVNDIFNQFLALKETAQAEFYKVNAEAITSAFKKLAESGKYDGGYVSPDDKEKAKADPTGSTDAQGPLGGDGQYDGDYSGPKAKVKAEDEDEDHDEDCECSMCQSKEEKSAQAKADDKDKVPAKEALNPMKTAMEQAGIILPNTVWGTATTITKDDYAKLANTKIDMDKVFNRQNVNANAISPTAKALLAGFDIKIR